MGCYISVLITKETDYFVLNSRFGTMSTEKRKKKGTSGNNEIESWNSNAANVGGF